MAKLAKPLSDKALKALKATGKNVTLYDWQGLQIVATIYGKKTWRFVYTFDGKKKTITLGNYPDISLAFLPLSHVFERAWTFFCLYKARSNGIATNITRA